MRHHRVGLLYFYILYTPSWQIWQNCSQFEHGQKLSADIWSVYLLLNENLILPYFTLLAMHIGRLVLQTTCGKTKMMMTKMRRRTMMKKTMTILIFSATQTRTITILAMMIMTKMTMTKKTLMKANLTTNHTWSNWRLSDEAQKALDTLLAERLAHREKDFGNARYVRNLFEKVISHQAKRLSRDGVNDQESLAVLYAEDIYEWVATRLIWLFIKWNAVQRRWWRFRIVGWVRRKKEKIRATSGANP